MPSSDIERSGFFNAQLKDGTYDREYEAEDFSKYFELFFGDGVFVNPADQLMVKANSGLTLSISPGHAFIDGHYYELTESTTMVIPTSSATRRVNVVLKLDMTSRTILLDFEIQEGTGGVIPNITRKTNSDNIKYLYLATIPLQSGTSTVTDSMITDLRPNEAYCGYVKGAIEEISTGDLFQQFTDEFNTWFNQMKGQLSTDAAGNLQNQIDSLDEQTAADIAQIKTEIQENTAVIKQTFNLTKGGIYTSVDVNYPEGYSRENCYIKSCMVRAKGTGSGMTSPGSWYYGSNVLNSVDVGARMEEDNIMVFFSVSSGSLKGEHEVLVVLEKLPAES